MTVVRRLLAALISLGLLAIGGPAAADDAGAKPKYSPPLGAVFSNPLNGHGRDILNQVIRSIEAAPKGSTIRLAVWNYADARTTDALIAAKARGVRIQVVVAETVTGNAWFRLRAALGRNPHDDSFAYRCDNACRSHRFVMHSKFFLFSKVGKRRHVSMFGSSNLTAAAGNRQWNDQVTTVNKGVYRYLVQTFEEYAADQDVATPYDEYENSRYRVVLFPRPQDNPIAEALSKVGCHSAKKERTVIRIAVAGWFDEFGIKIAREVRRLWDRGCDVRIVTTLAGRRINRILKRRYGRGPVPIRQVTVDYDKDGVPERYMHMKSIAVDGKYDGDPRRRMLFTGSPNWSGDARASDEVWFEVRDAPSLVRAYSRFTDQMFFGPAAHAREQVMQRPSAVRRSVGDPGYEL